VSHDDVSWTDADLSVGQKAGGVNHWREGSWQEFGSVDSLQSGMSPCICNGARKVDGEPTTCGAGLGLQTDSPLSTLPEPIKEDASTTNEERMTLVNR
jgi:hypothetical protein